MGRFLTEDPVFGDLSDPPSLHWYTFGKVNPTVWIDPDGRIDILERFSGFLRRGGTDEAAEASGDLAEEIDHAFGDNFVTRRLKGGAAVALGVFGAGADVLAFGVDATSFVADGMVASLSPDTTMGREAEERLVETMGALSDTWDVISENPEEVATQLAKGAGEVVVGAARGDAASQTKLTSFVAQSLNAGSAGRSTARSTGRATAKSVAEVGEQAAKRADEAVAALNASNRARRSAQQSTTSPKPRTATPQAVGRTATPQKCFVAGTPVWTETGMKPIGEIEIGDWVWSRSEETGELRVPSPGRPVRSPRGPPREPARGAEERSVVADPAVRGAPRALSVSVEHTDRGHTAVPSRAPLTSHCARRLERPARFPGVPRSLRASSKVGASLFLVSATR